MATDDAGNSYRQGIVWVVGMSAAAAGGAFLHYDLARGLPWLAKAAFILIVFLFLVAIWAGVNCLFWLFYKASEEGKLKKLEEDHDQGKISDEDYSKKKKAGMDELARVKKWRNGYHNTLLWTFAPAILTSIVFLTLGTFSSPSTIEQNETCPTKNKCRCQGAENKLTERFLITQSAVHRTANGREAHTFLLDQEKGSLWVMTCSKHGIVEFHRVQTLSLTGAPEDPSK